MNIVIKVGGTLLETPQDRMRIVERVAQQFRTGQHRILLVHGGGKLLTAYLERAGVASQFMQGLRVTTAEAIDGVVKVFAGTVNHQLLASFHQAGVPAVGISGIDAGCLIAERLAGQHGEDWGYVGKVTRANPRVWEVLLDGGLLPVMACLAVGDDGQIYNVNADQAAVACAMGMHADALIFLTDVDGVRGMDGRTMHSMEAAAIPGLIQSGAVTGGMLAKLNAVREALDSGISRVHIASGHYNDSIQNGISFCASDGFRANKAESGTTVLATAMPVQPAAKD
ncbi:MAG: acetylglutamate kinase [Acidobacteria bacterium]|nr:acetylglutamate kinase [Acidobacteriota bacterium]